LGTSKVKDITWRLCVAPMMQYTDRHFRYFARIMSNRARLYTEMVVCDALLRGDAERFLDHSIDERPVALQLGGSDPKDLSTAAKMGASAGYSEINLNVGCPSDRVKSGRFGACLMAEPILVAECLQAMRESVDIPVTVKTRIGIDRNDSYDEFTKFVEAVDSAQCAVIIVHARKAWLDGLSPRENREIPPLRYDIVRQLKFDFPHLTVVINGGIKTVEQATSHLSSVDGVMLGRAAYETPYLLSSVDKTIFDRPEKEESDRRKIFDRYLRYAEAELEGGTPLRKLTKPLHYLFQGQPGARQWRRHLSEHCSQSGARIGALASAIRHVERAPARLE